MSATRVVAVGSTAMEVPDLGDRTGCPSRPEVAHSSPLGMKSAVTLEVAADRDFERRAVVRRRGRADRRPGGTRGDRGADGTGLTAVAGSAGSRTGRSRPSGLHLPGR